MSEDTILENKGAKYSEMLMQLMEEFDTKLPKNFTLEDALETGIDAWNLSVNKEYLESNDLYEEELKSHKNHLIIEEMVAFKTAKFPTSTNVIIDYTIDENENLLVITKTQKEFFNNLINLMLEEEEQE